ncbi:hypothetical protein G3570_02310 [Balneolaceae bacterium YR4-1]|uniref:SPW repeat-containing protein n=1 Tax=Halalkalibaculum roseum TaxID=2709311 RepID=A0A6M1SK89_9BACT|nr:hypothetical protein [Halalkalibaculum roseum]NGP75449.1 hypothetical protein [Halalkalibaculum roseum]
MNKLPPFAHGLFDYLTVIYFFVAPSLFTLTPTVATISYLLGAVHLMLTLFTNFPLGVKKIIPFRVHGFIELIVSVLLMIMPLLMGESVTFYDSLFFILTGVAILLIWILSRYKQKPKPPIETSTENPSETESS